jgi:alkaline phosphatase
MFTSDQKWFCDICGREIEFSARNKRFGLRIDKLGLLIRESPLGDVCGICRPILRDGLPTFLDDVRRLSLDENTVPPTPPEPPITPPKYIFLFIGDGMGVTHIKATENYFGEKLSFSEFPCQTLCTTHSADSAVTDSAAAATALSCGVKTNNNMVALDPQGGQLVSLATLLRNHGYKIGLATSVSIDHATPAPFYAHAIHRNNYNEIARQIAESGFDFFASSGVIDPDGVYGGLVDSDYIIVTSNDYDIINSIPLNRKLFLRQNDRFDQNSLIAAYNLNGDDGWRLEDFVQIGIRRLYNNSLSDGFFFMVEGGMIDWTAHANETFPTIYETKDFSEAIKPAVDFYNLHPDETLIVVTADHETGAASLPSEDSFDIIWGSSEHSEQLVPVYAKGVTAHQFDRLVVGNIDNTDIPKKILGGI